MSADRARLRELLDAGTPRPWVVTDDGHALVCADELAVRPVETSDLALVAAAVNALPGLLDALDRVEALAGEWARDDRTLGSPGVVFKGQAADQLRAALGEMDDSAERGPR